MYYGGHMRLKKKLQLKMLPFFLEQAELNIIKLAKQSKVLDSQHK